MKNIIYIFIASLGLLVGCGEDYLEVSPEDFQSASNYFNTQEQFVQAVTSAYSPLQPLYTESFWAMGEMRSDNTTYQYNEDDRSGFPLERLDEFREIDDNGIVYSFYSNSFVGISRCNTVLQRIEDATMDAEIKDRIIGEASFLRGFYYFNLVRFFGDVPLVLEEIKSTDEAFAAGKRKSEDVIYETIIADLLVASENLPVAYTDNENAGRATQGAAKALLAKVYMTRGDFEAAIPELREVTQLGYMLLNNYADLYDPANKNNAESLFEIQYLEGSFGEYSDFIYTFAPYNAGASITGFGMRPGAGVGWNIPTKDLLEAYEEGDPRKGISINQEFTDPNTDEIVPYIEKYLSPHSVRYQTNDNFPVIRYADVLLMLAECLNEVGFTPNGEAYNLLNQVRRRVGLPDKTAGNPNPLLNVNSQAAFREAVWQERRVELAFENHRWFDLLRTGRAQAVMQEHGQQQKAMKPYMPPDAFQNIRLEYLFPRREVDLTE